MSCVPQALLMNRKRFESLPADVQAIIRKHSGAWFVDNYTRINEASTALVLNQLKSDSRRTVTIPSAADMKTADVAFKSIVDGYAAMNSHNAELVDAARAAVASLHSAR
jgi:TRAP-type C4-dicarboxylate transport system substrate-binding protein